MTLKLDRRITPGYGKNTLQAGQHDPRHAARLRRPLVGGGE